MNNLKLTALKHVIPY